jgi:hypothetical protein
MDANSDTLKGGHRTRIGNGLGFLALVRKLSGDRMAIESKPLFHREVIRQRVRSFPMPERVAEWVPKLERWGGLI